MYNIINYDFVTVDSCQFMSKKKRLTCSHKSYIKFCLFHVHNYIHVHVHVHCTIALYLPTYSLCRQVSCCIAFLSSHWIPPTTTQGSGARLYASPPTSPIPRCPPTLTITLHSFCWNRIAWQGSKATSSTLTFSS